MALKNILHKKTWEPMTQPSTVWTGNAGNCICWDTYKETGTSEMYCWPGAVNLTSLYIYDSQEDSWEFPGIRTGGLSVNQVNNDWPGNALAYSSLGFLSGKSFSEASSNSTTVLNTQLKIVKDLTGKKIRIIGGDNAGYEGTITSNTIGVFSTITISPPTALPNLISKIEIYSCSIFAIWASGTIVSPAMQIYDIATDTWYSRSSPSLNTWVQYSIKMTNVPQLDHVYDTALLTSSLINWLPSNIRYGSWVSPVGSTVTTDGTMANNLYGLQFSSRIDYTSGTGYFYNQLYCLKSNTTYTVSAWVKTPFITSTITFSIEIGAVQFTQIVPTSGVFTRQSYTFTTGEVTTNLQKVGFISTNPILYIDSIQLEENSSVGTYLDTTYNTRHGSTNLIPDSRSTAWVANANTITHGQTDPFNGTTSALLTDASTSSALYFANSVGANIYNKQFTASVWLKAGTATTCDLYLAMAGVPYTIVASQIGITLTSKWVRYSLTGLGLLNVNNTLSFYTFIGTQAGVNEGTIYAAWPQIEYGSDATEYVETTVGVAKTRYVTGSSLAQLNFTGKDWMPGSLKNYRVRFTTPSYVNLLAYSTDFSNGTSWTLTGGSTKTGNVLNITVDSMRCDVRPTGLSGYLKAGTYTFYIIASGSGTFSMFSYNMITAASGTRYVQTLSATPTRFVLTFSFAQDGGFPVFGRSVGDTATAITVYGGQLEYGTVAHDLIPTTTTIGYSGGTQYVPIIDNDISSITVPMSFGNVVPNGTTVYIEPNGDDIYLSGNQENAIYLYNQRADAWLSQEIIPTKPRGSVPGWEHSAIFVNKINGWNLPKSVPIRQVSTTYTYGDKITSYLPNLNYDYVKSALLECITPGTSSNSTLSGLQYNLNIVQDTVVDGTAIFTPKLVEQPGRYIYSFRGQSSNTLNIFDITTQMWHSCDSSVNFRYGNNGGIAGGITTGSSYCQIGNYIYIEVPYAYAALSKYYRFDIKAHKLEPILYNRYRYNGVITTGQRIWPTYKTVGAENYVFLNSMATANYDRSRLRID